MSPKSEYNALWISRIAIAVAGFLTAAAFTGVKNEIRDLRIEMKDAYTTGIKNEGRIDALESNVITVDNIRLYIREEF